MARGKRQRKVLLGLGVVAGGLCLLLVSLPLWFPWVLRPLARWQGASFGIYEREGYRRFALTDLRFTNDTTSLRAQRVEAFVPSVWLWKAYRGSKFQGTNAAQAGTVRETFAKVQNWELELLPSTNTSTNGSVYSSARDVRNTLQQLRHWLPRAVLTKGQIRSGSTLLVLPQVTWSQGWLTGQLEIPKQFSANVSIHQDESQVYHANIDSPQLNLHSQMEIATNSIGLALHSTNTWLTNRFEVHAQFGRSGSLPESATLSAPDLRVPSKLLTLGGYQDVTGAVSGKWENGAFGVDVHAGAVSARYQRLPPLQLDIHAFGDTNVATLERVLISTPWLTATLSQHLNVYFTGQLLREHAKLSLAADLGRQPWLPLHGKLNGSADFAPGTGKVPAGEFHLSGSKIGNSEVEAKQVKFDGSLAWPWIEVSNLEAIFDDGSKGLGRGRFQVESSTIEDGELQFDGPLLRRWLPTNYSFGDMSLSARIQGSTTNLVHSGHVEITNFVAPQIRPLQLKANWSGHQEDFVRAEATATADGSSLYVAGSVTNQGENLELRLNSLSLLTNQLSELTLEKPWSLSLKHSRSNGVYQIEETPFDWAGPAGRVHIEGRMTWPAQGMFRASMQNLTSSEIGPFFKTPIPGIELLKFQASLEWSNSPAKFGLELAAIGSLPAQLASSGATEQQSLAALDRERQEQLASESGRGFSAKGPYQLQLDLAGDEKGVTISNLLFSSAGSPITTAQGFVPVSFVPSDRVNLVHLETQQPLEFHVHAGSEAFFWQKLGALAGLSLKDPNLEMNVTGTWASPKGEVSLRVGQVLLPQTKTAKPTLRNLDVVLTLERQRARLVKGHLLVQDQPVSLTGELPLSQQFWNELRLRKLPNFEEASARLQIEHAKLAAAADLLPHFLTPEGEVDADLSLLPGGKFDGALAIHDARTRPLGEFGPLRHIELLLQAHERRLILQQATVDAGGSTVSLGGGVDLSGTGWFNGALPPFQVTLYGTNVPLSRQPESIIRSSFQLAVTKTNGAPPIITGLARLRDSYYLSDLRDLIPGKVASPQRRPPYFSVDEPALADWRLALRVQGPGFLRVRSSLFNGQVSADLQLQGTLKEPVALGDIKIDSGFVRFPFASLAVQQGFVSLTSENPYRPVLSVTAGSKQFGYTIKMEATGPIDSPVLQFTSTPPLNSEQILLMITAGQLPAGEYSMTTQQRAQTVAVFLGRDLLSKFGLEDQAEQRLTIKSGEEITEQGRPTYEVDFKLTDHWGLVGEYDRFGDYNGMFKWRVYSK